MKNSRHTRILEIIGENIIETQDDLLEKLRESGYPVTQATVSRDIKQLGLVKTATKNGGYRYAAAANEGAGNESKLKNIMRETILSAENAENIVVIKTYSGMANAAAAAVDALSGDSVVGSIAGDDTIFIVVRSDEKAVEFTAFVKDIIGMENARRMLFADRAIYQPYCHYQKRAYTSGKGADCADGRNRSRKIHHHRFDRSYHGGARLP